MKTSIIILTYNQLPLTKQCLTSINKHTNQEEIEIIVVDNGSTDGTIAYLKSIPSLKTIFNEKNLGFAKGCNQGLDIATGDRVLFLNNDTIVTKNWLQSMIVLLYSDEKIGMVGPVSNYVSGPQQITVDYTDTQAIEEFSSEYCKNELGKSKGALRLVGFCLLIKREVLDKIGGFDERFEYGSFEDDDLCLRGLQAGYQLKIALDSFVHHHGHATFTGNQDINMHHLFNLNRQKFIDKWKINLSNFFFSRSEIVELVPLEAKKILDIGCGAGANGLELLNRQSCELYGIEQNSFIGSIANNHYERVDTIDIETLALPYSPDSFDTIILADVLEHLKNPWQVVEKLSVYLKPSGSLICSIPNISHAEALLPLLFGSWNYVDAGILDRTHLRFFTPQTVQSLFPLNLFEIQSQTYNYVALDSKVQLFFSEVSYLAEKFGFSMKDLSDYINIYQILIHAKKL
ncbi:glycosyltransferase [Priestia megaterium]